MKATVISQSRPAPNAFGLWLGVALLLHALLLLVPARETGPVAGFGRSLEIHLAPRERPTVPAVPTAADGWQAAPHPDEAAARPAESPGVPPMASDAVPDSEPRAAPAAPDRITNAAALLEALARLDWDHSPDETTRQLGQPRPIPEARSRFGGLMPAPNRFDGLMAPAEPEVVDRWLAADGSHNVVVRSTSGETYCGRAEAWNPMNPLYEPIMMWRPCGGGGERAFGRLSSAKIKPPGRDGRLPRSR